MLKVHVIRLNVPCILEGKSCQLAEPMMSADVLTVAKVLVNCCGWVRLSQFKLKNLENHGTVS